ncbi:MAG: hypothetical protein GTO08_12355, partial [Deltaproteobacteria bacterium]|nr:hypothetical protein [Deltaproteobacteria bacterium]
SLIPLEPRGKKPLIPWTDYQRICSTPEERAEWKRRYPDCNWGLVTGKVSGVVALDFDGEEGKTLRKEKNLYGPYPASI